MVTLGTEILVFLDLVVEFAKVVEESLVFVL